VKPVKRKHTARELAERLGVSERTIQRLMAQPRAEYEAETHARQDEALRLREAGMKWADVGAELGGITDSAAYQLAAKAKNRRAQSVA
jgi:CTP-dependent riboflavin kinase